MYVCIMAAEGTNGAGHTEDLLLIASKRDCDSADIPEICRDGRTF